jgi:cytochrome bd-type quinol oxidase subunit 1
MLLFLAGQFNLNRPDVHFPFIGNKWLVGLFFLTHIIFGSFSMGAVLLSPAFEWLGVRRADPRFERLAHGIAATNLKVFSLGATLGSFAVLVLLGLYPKLFTSLITSFFWPMLLAFLSWFITIPLLLLYVFRWRAMELRKGAHITIGVAGGLSEQLFLVLIVGLDSFLLTPSKTLGLQSFFNASYLPELGHRFVGNLSWSAFFIAAVMAAYAGFSRQLEERLYFHWAARVSLVVGFVTLVLQVILGFVFVESIKNASYGAFLYSLTGTYSWLWLLQGLLLAVLLAGTNLYFLASRAVPGVSFMLTAIVTALAILEMAPSVVYPRPLFWLRYVFLAAALLLSIVHWLLWRRPRDRVIADLARGGRLVVTVTGTAALLLFLLMGVIRETARGDYTVYGQLKAKDSQGLFAPSKGFYP